MSVPRTDVPAEEALVPYELERLRRIERNKKILGEVSVIVEYCSSNLAGAPLAPDDFIDVVNVMWMLQRTWESSVRSPS
jgi:hypothetical protein